MLRLSPRSPPSPRTVRTLRTFHSTAASPASLAHREWSPGDPIRFGGTAMQRTDSDSSTAGEEGGERVADEMSTRGSGGREWTPGEPIRFGVVEESQKTIQGGSAQQEKRDSSSTSLFRPSAITTATRGSSPSTRPRASPSSSTQSWPLSHRWDPPSPSPSSLSGLSNGSTARFSPSHSYATVSAAPREVVPPKTPSRVQLSQVELDELVAGVDFEDTSELLDDVEHAPVASTSRTPGRAPQLAPEELDELLEGIDFSEGFELSDEEVDAGTSFESEELFFTAVPSPRPTTPATPPPAPTARLFLRNSPSSRPPPSPPTQADVFSPTTGPSTSSARPAVASSPLRQTTTSSSAPFSPVLPPSPATSALPTRPYSTEAKGKGKMVIDLCDSPSSPPRSSPAVAANDPDRSDDSVVLLPPKRRPTQTLAAPGQSPQPNGWFVRPPSFASKLKPAPSSSSAFASAAPPTTASSALTAASSRYPRRPSPPASSSTLSPMPNFPSSRPPRPGSKRAKAEERQVELRKKWPREFTYRNFGGVKVKLMVSTDEGEIERELRGMEGPLGFDLEWNPYVRGKGGAVEQGKTALVQVCDASTILLVPVSRMPRFPPALKAVIEDPQRIKLGVQIAGDATKLTRDFGHHPSGTLELNALVRTYDGQRLVGRSKPGLIGLQELTGIYLDRYLPKETDVRCGKWTAKLSAEQIEYAANDVYASLHVLLAIQALSDKDITHEDLAQLASRPYNSFYGFSRPAAAPVTLPARDPSLVAPAQSSSSTSTPANPPSSPSAVLSPRKLEAFNLFHLERLSIIDISLRMSATQPIKPSSVLWSLLSSFQLMKAAGMTVEWDSRRLVQAADEVQWSSRMREEHGGLIEELRGKLVAE